MTVRLSNDLIQLECYPEHGFVISGIWHTSDPRNILWNPPGARFEPLSAAELGPAGFASVATFDLAVLAGGWFPMFPTAGLPGNSTELWMHGEAARIPWALVAETARSITCHARTPATGIALERTITLDDESIVVTTKAENQSDTDRLISYGEHPCFAGHVFAGGRLNGSIEHAETTSPADLANSVLTERRSFAWPTAPLRTGELLDLSRLPTRPDGRHDHVSLAGASGMEVRGQAHVATLYWDNSLLPYALLWEHFRPTTSPWDGDVFAIEPSSAPGRTADDAKEANALRTLRSGESLSYWVGLNLRPAVRAEG